MLNEVPDLCKSFDFRQQAFGLFAREAHQRGVHENIFNAGELQIKTGAEFQEGGHAAFMPDTAVGWFERSGDDLQQGGLAAAVWSDDPNRGAGLDLKADVAECPELSMPLPAPARKRLFQAITRMRIDAVLFGNALNAQGNWHSRPQIALISTSLSPDFNSSIAFGSVAARICLSRALDVLPQVTQMT